MADIFAARNIELGLETGQETAAWFDSFLRKLQRANVGVNFDPANMILYDKGNPIEALKGLAPWLKQCHIKDANRTARPGTWGEEVPRRHRARGLESFLYTLRQHRVPGQLVY